MAETSQDAHHPDELRSDLDVLIEMARDGKQDEEAVRRALNSLKTKLDTFVHGTRGHSAGGQG